MRNLFLNLILLTAVALNPLQAYSIKLLAHQTALKVDSLELTADEKELLDAYGYAPKIKHIKPKFEATFSPESYLDAASFKKMNTVTSFVQEDLFYSSNNVSIKKIYPNPADEMAFLDYNILEQLKAKITIRNLLGKVVKEYELIKGEGQIKIPTLKFVSGVYFYTLSIKGKELKTKKLIIEHR